MKEISQYANKHNIAFNEKQRERKYWIGKLSGNWKDAAFPSSDGKGKVHAGGAGSIHFTVRDDLYTLLERVCPQDQSLFMVLTAALFVQLYKFLEEPSLVVGTAINKEFENKDNLNVIVPLFINMPSGLTFREALHQVRQTCMEAQANQNYPIELLWKALDEKIDQKLYRTAIFLKNIQNPHVAFLEEGPELVFGFEKRNHGLHCTVEFDAGLYLGTDISLICEDYQELLHNCLSNPDRKISLLDACTPERTRKLAAELNDTAVPYPRDASIHGIFAEQAGKFPHKIALIHEGRHLTYRELEEKATILAGKLIARGVTTNSPVAVLLKKGIDYIVSILAVLKAGGVYVPISPEYPVKRINYLLDDTRAGIILTDPDMVNDIDFHREDREVLFPGETDWTGEPSPSDIIPPSPGDTIPFDMAYILFTSGSTGRPKGVLVSHRNVLRLVKNTNYVPFSPDTRILLTGSLTFDATTFEIWGSLLNGGTLSILDNEDLADPDKLYRELIRDRITTLWLTSPLFNQIVQVSEKNIFHTLEHLVIGGDVLSPANINKVRRDNKDLQIINGYGPTENTTFSLTLSIREEYKGPIPIGRPIANSTAYVLGKDLGSKPMLAWGTLYVGGDGVAAGYLNNPELTYEKMIPNPYGPGFLYRTDDLARVLPDLNIAFKGRLDNQVKISGHRIELGEIQSCLSKMPGIGDVYVMAHEDARGNKRICAYFISGPETGDREVKAFLEAHLPGYMVPKQLIRLDKFPLTGHGKIDNSRLPSPERESQEDNKWDEVERELAKIWSSLLEINESSISRSSDYFDLGGQSLNIMSLGSEIHKAFNVKMPIRQLFKSSGFGQQASYIRNAGRTGFPGIKPAEKKEYYQLSSAQLRLYIIQQLNLDSTAYNIFVSRILEGNADLEKYERSFRQLIERHESLRTAFIGKDGKIWQKIYQQVPFNIEYLDRTDANFDIREFVKPFDLARPPLLRVTVIKTDEHKHILLADLHHIISDGISQEILVKEFDLLNNGLPLPDSRISYKDFSQWQQHLTSGNLLKVHEEYWLNEFRDEIPVLNLPLDYPRPRIRDYEGRTLHFDFPAELTKDLKAVCSRGDITLYMLLMSLWSVVLSKFCCQEDLVIGMPIAGRKHHELNSVVGMFVNTMPIRSFPSCNKTFSAYLGEIKDNVIQALEHQHYQFEDLIDRLSIPRSTSRNPVFDVAFNLLPARVEGNDVVTSPEGQAGFAKFDLSLNVTETGNGIHFDLEYLTSLFKKETILRIIDGLKKAARSVCINPDGLIADIDIIGEEEKRRLLHTFNDTDLAYPSSGTMHGVIEAVAAAAPGSIALVDRNGEITYGELMERAGQLASVLQQKGVKEGEVIGLSMENCKEMVIGMLGILKAGAAFLPFDPGLPAERVKYMLREAGTTLLICQEELSNRFAPVADLVLMEKITGETGMPGPSMQDPDGLAYIIFTSGTTGVPNGVKISHRSLLNLCAWHCDYYKVSAQDRGAKYASLSFDATIWEIFPYLYRGASLYFIDGESKYDIDKLSSGMEANGVTICFLPTQIGEKFTGLKNKSLKKLLLGGDKVKELQIDNNSYEVYNNYGPTENTVVTTACKIETLADNIPIGKPIANTKLFILHPSSQELMPFAIPGELCISGDSLALGYLDADLTRKSFVPNPYRSGQLMYRTGDLAKWLPDGNLAFLGRINDQIKMRGYRIELAEIENYLARFPGIMESVAVYKERENGNNFLCTYYTAVEEIDVGLIKKHLSEYLPSYMLPLCYIRMERMPLTHSGKIDKRSLPEPVISAETGYEAPQGALQTRLVEIWAELLGLNGERIGVHDNFFELGGNSLKIIQLKSKIMERLKTDVPVVNLFEFTSVHLLAEFLEKGAFNRARELESLIKSEKESLNVLDQTMEALGIGPASL